MAAVAVISLMTDRAFADPVVAAPQIPTHVDCSDDRRRADGSCPSGGHATSHTSTYPFLAQSGTAGNSTDGKPKPPAKLPELPKLPEPQKLPERPKLPEPPKPPEPQKPPEPSKPPAPQKPPAPLEPPKPLTPPKPSAPPKLVKAAEPQGFWAWVFSPSSETSHASSGHASESDVMGHSVGHAGFGGEAGGHGGGG